MQNLQVLDRIQISRDVKNIDEPTKSSITEYLVHGFGKIDTYLLPVIKKTDAPIKFKVQLEKKGNGNYIGWFYFNFPGILKDFHVEIDENTPVDWLPQIVAELFKKADNVLQKEVKKLHEKH